MGPALRVRLTARAASARAYARSARRPGPAWYWKKSAYGTRDARACGTSFLPCAESAWRKPPRASRSPKGA